MRAIGEQIGDWRAWTLAAATVFATAWQLHFQGRRWICDCGYVLFWTGEAWGGATSQHLFDPYSFTHLLHGFMFSWLWLAVAHRVSLVWQGFGVVALECAWEIIENTDFVIDRYREATAALGYRGDTVINSVGDIIFCAVGFALARLLGPWRSLAAFAIVETALIVFVRDSLLLNLLMLVWPVDGIKHWQLGR